MGGRQGNGTPRLATARLLAGFLWSTATSRSTDAPATTKAQIVSVEVDTLETMVTPPPTVAPSGAPMPRRRWWIPLIVLAAVLSIGVIGASYVAVPYVAYAPRDARPTNPKISVDGVPTYPVDGQVLFVTVGTPRLTALGWVVGHLDPSKVDVYTEEQVFGTQTEEQNRQENLKLMTYSKDFASYVALKKLGYPVSVDHGGVVIQSLCLQTDANGTCTRQSSVSNILKVNDVITAVNGT